MPVLWVELCALSVTNPAHGAGKVVLVATVIVLGVGTGGTTRTHYEVLGVAPDADIVEIRNRYRVLARQLHPDHQGTSAVGDEMAAVNEAWAVLGDPVRRAAYDHGLTGATTERPATSGPRYAPSNPPPEHQPVPGGCLIGAAGFLPWIGLLVLLAAIFVFTAYAGSDRDDADPTEDPPLVAVRDLRGSCIHLVGGATTVVDCFTIPHEGVIVAQASPGAACPDGTIEWFIRQQDVLACTDPGTEVRPP